MALILVLQLVILGFLLMNRREADARLHLEPVATLPESTVRQTANAPVGVEPAWTPLEAHLASLQADMDRQLAAMMRGPLLLDPIHDPAMHLGLRREPAMRRVMHDAWANFRALENRVRFDDGWTSLMASPTLDMREAEHQYIVVCTLPGLPADAVRVLLNGRLLTIRTDEAAPGAEACMRYERRILLPGPVDQATAAQACWTNGVLRIAIPKAPLSRESAAEERL